MWEVVASTTCPELGMLGSCRTRNKKKLRGRNTISQAIAPVVGRNCS
jgi:hypothetical protein